MTDEKAPAVILGAGVIGCAVAHELAKRGVAAWVLERGPRIAEGVTSRNSGVIHAGIYYRPGSLKAESCVRGNRLLYEWCEARGVPYRRTGKWIVGTSSQEGALASLLANAKESGAPGLRWLTKQEIAQTKDLLCSDIGIVSPETGIIDPYELARSLMLASEDNGATFLLNTSILGVETHSPGRYRLLTSRGSIETNRVVNATGLFADKVAAMAGVTKYKIHPCRGDYFRLHTSVRYPHLIYPMRNSGDPGLGVHLTIGMDGSYRLGPDAFYVKSHEDFSDPIVDSAQFEEKKTMFLRAASLYLRGITADQITYDSCGIRPKLRSPVDSEEKDFVLSEDLPGWLNLVGIESPGLTASLDLAQRIASF